MYTKEWMRIFSDNLSYMLEYTNISQRDLADAAGISESCISKYLTGKALPSVISIVNICNALDCEVDDLIYLDEHVI